jgi:hypothetical protein
MSSPQIAVRRSLVVGCSDVEAKPLDLCDDVIGRERRRVVCHGQPCQPRVGDNLLNAGQRPDGALDRVGLGGAAHALYRAGEGGCIRHIVTRFIRSLEQLFILYRLRRICQ